GGLHDQRVLEILRHHLLVAGQPVLDSTPQSQLHLWEVRRRSPNRRERFVALRAGELRLRLQQDDVGDHSSSFFFFHPNFFAMRGGGPLARVFRAATLRRTALAARLPAATLRRAAFAARLPAATLRRAAFAARFPAATLRRTAFAARLPAATLRRTALAARFP